MERTVALSEFFDENTYLVAGMCRRCYAESEDVKIVGVNTRFLGQVCSRLGDVSKWRKSYEESSLSETVRRAVRDKENWFVRLLPEGNSTTTREFSDRVRNELHAKTEVGNLASDFSEDGDDPERLCEDTLRNVTSNVPKKDAGELEDRRVIEMETKLVESGDDTKSSLLNENGEERCVEASGLRRGVNDLGIEGFYERDDHVVRMETRSVENLENGKERATYSASYVRRSASRNRSAAPDHKMESARKENDLWLGTYHVVKMETEDLRDGAEHATHLASDARSSALDRHPEASGHLQTIPKDEVEARGYRAQFTWNDLSRSKSFPLEDFERFASAFYFCPDASTDDTEERLRGSLVLKCDEETGFGIEKEESQPTCRSSEEFGGFKTEIEDEKCYDAKFSDEEARRSVSFKANRVGRTIDLGLILESDETEESDTRRNCPEEDAKPNLGKLKTAVGSEREQSLFFPSQTPGKSSWVPPRSPHNLIEESLYHDPWKLLVATIFLNKTSCASARPYIERFFADNPDPRSVLRRNPEDLEVYFTNIGLRKRSRQVWKMSRDFVHKKWRNVAELHGIGRYGKDAYNMFCLGDMGTEPEDRFLRIYRAWFKMVGAGVGCEESAEVVDDDEDENAVDRECGNGRGVGK